MDDCVFCKIINGDIPSDKVYEDDDIIAIHDINPIAKVHVLVIPKKHVKDFIELEDEDLQIKLNKAIKETAKILNIAEDGYRVITNIGENGGQAVKHLHFHILGGEKLPTR